LLLGNGRIAGISGILGGVLSPAPGDVSWRLMFLIGLIVTGALAGQLVPASFAPIAPRSALLIIVAGLLVGYGTRLGNGCTSGHGVCGLGRRSPRSLAATLTFLSTGALTVFLMRHVLLGAP
jgi:hypothetical protein